MPLAHVPPFTTAFLSIFVVHNVHVVWIVLPSIHATIMRFYMTIMRFGGKYDDGLVKCGALKSDQECEIGTVVYSLLVFKTLQLSLSVLVRELDITQNAGLKASESLLSPSEERYVYNT